MAGAPQPLSTWELELIGGGATMPEIAAAIERINQRIASTLGVPLTMMVHPRCMKTVNLVRVMEAWKEFK